MRRSARGSRVAGRGPARTRSERHTTARTDREEVAVENRDLLGARPLGAISTGSRRLDARPGSLIVAQGSRPRARTAHRRRLSRACSGLQGARWSVAVSWWAYRRLASGLTSCCRSGAVHGGARPLPFKATSSNRGPRKGPHPAQTRMVEPVTRASRSRGRFSMCGRSQPLAHAATSASGKNRPCARGLAKLQSENRLCASAMR